jgi:hypothetical protein
VSDWKNSRVATLAAATLLLGAGLGFTTTYADTPGRTSTLVAAPVTTSSPSRTVPSSATTGSATAVPTTGPTSGPTTASTAPNGTAAPTATTAPLQAPAPVNPQAPHPRQWVTVASLKGSKVGDTSAFQLLTGDTRARYAEDPASGKITVYLVPAGTTANPTNQRIISCNSNCGGTSNGTVAPGGYSLHIDSAATSWVVVIEEAR